MSNFKIGDKLVAYKHHENKYIRGEVLSVETWPEGHTEPFFLSDSDNISCEDPTLFRFYLDSGNYVYPSEVIF